MRSDSASARGARWATRRSPAATSTSAARRCERAAPVMRPRWPSSRRRGRVEARLRGPAGAVGDRVEARRCCGRAATRVPRDRWRAEATSRSSWRATLRTARLAMADQVPSSAPASSATRATRSCAQAVGVLAAVWATSSATERVDLVADAGEHRHRRTPRWRGRPLRRRRRPGRCGPRRLARRASTSGPVGGEHADRRGDRPRPRRGPAPACRRAARGRRSRCGGARRGSRPRRRSPRW